MIERKYPTIHEIETFAKAIFPSIIVDSEKITSMRSPDRFACKCSCGAEYTNIVQDIFHYNIHNSFMSRRPNVDKCRKCVIIEKNRKRWEPTLEFIKTLPNLNINVDDISHPNYKFTYSCKCGNTVEAKLKSFFRPEYRMLCKKCDYKTRVIKKDRFCKECNSIIDNDSKKDLCDKCKDKKRIEYINKKKIRKEEKRRETKRNNPISHRLIQKLKTYKKLLNTGIEIISYKPKSGVLICRCDNEGCDSIVRTHIKKMNTTCGFCKTLQNYTHISVVEKMTHGCEVIDKDIEWFTRNKEYELKCSCGNTFMRTVSQMKRNKPKLVCEDCKPIVSKGEMEVQRVLKKYNYSYIKEKTFDDLKSEKGYPLRYDFYLPEYNILIEYDGEQHFKDVEFYRGSASVIEVRKRDAIKDEYSINNNINLLRIPYTEYPYIENKIQEYINEN